MWYDPCLKLFIDRETARTSANYPLLHSEDPPTGFLYFTDGNVAQRISSQGVAVYVPLFDPLVPYLPMVDLTVPNISLDKVAGEMETVQSLLAQVGVYNVGIYSMADAVAKIHSMAIISPLAVPAQ